MTEILYINRQILHFIKKEAIWIAHLQKALFSARINAAASNFKICEFPIPKNTYWTYIFFYRGINTMANIDLL